MELIYLDPWLYISIQPFAYVFSKGCIQFGWLSIEWSPSDTPTRLPDKPK